REGAVADAVARLFVWGNARDAVKLDIITIFPAVRNDFGWIYSTSEPPEGTNMSGESLVVILFVGVVAGWLAGQIVRGTGFGIVSDLVVGIIGAFIGDWLLPRLGVHLGVGIIAAIADATIGAILLLLVVRLVRGGGYWERSGGGRRWGGWGSRRDYGTRTGARCSCGFCL